MPDALDKAIDDLCAAADFWHQVKADSKAGYDTTWNGAFRDAQEWLRDAGLACADAMRKHRTDATRLLAESQAHNAKLEAQVERMRELVLTCATRLEFADTMLTAAAGEPTPDNFKYSRDCAEAAKRCGQVAEEARDALKD